MIEHDCWFQKGKRASGFSGKAPGSVCAGEKGIIIENAVAEYVWGMERLFGMQVNPLNEAAGTVRETARIGTISFLNEKYALNLRAQEPGGFVIRAGADGVVVAGQDECGVLYGVYHLLLRLARGNIQPGVEISDAPAASLRIVNHWDNLDGSIERGYAGASIFYRDNRLDYDPARMKDYARLLASVGINRISINNVNVRGAAKLLITDQYLRDIAGLASIFRPFGIRLILSLCFGAPWSLGGLPTADPLDPRVAGWWRERCALIYGHVPDLAGFLVKADSEGEPGPFQYGRTHAEGANMLARAVSPYGGEIFWRCFVYNCQQDWRDKTVDRACASYNNFKPLDGAFDKNVILQIKHGPYDFQVREPVSPLFGDLPKTRHIMELQITQEYTGQQIDLCYLPRLWTDIMNFDTARGPGTQIKELLRNPEKKKASPIDGLAAVSNVGMDNNWTGHTLAQANLFGYGRLAWNPELGAEEIAKEWSELTFNAGENADSITSLLLQSYPVYEKYTAPFGVCFMVTPGLHYGPSVEGYEFSRWGTYHRANRESIGIDRTPRGTAYTEQYAPANAALFADASSCPEDLLLFFHRLPFEFCMKNGETLLQNIYNNHFDGYEEAAAMLEQWKGLKDSLDEEVYLSVLDRFERQLLNAREWRDQINTYFWRKTGIGDKQGRQIFE
jgi:alpha-glucuronidase